MGKSAIPKWYNLRVFTRTIEKGLSWGDVQLAGAIWILKGFLRSQGRSFLQLREVFKVASRCLSTKKWMSGRLQYCRLDYALWVRPRDEAWHKAEWKRNVYCAGILLCGFLFLCCPPVLRRKYDESPALGSRCSKSDQPRNHSLFLWPTYSLHPSFLP